MKRALVIAAIVALLLLAWFANRLAYAPAASGGIASVSLMGVTNNALGERVAWLCFTNSSSVAAICSSYFVDYKVGNTWSAQPSVPAVVRADIPSVLELRPGQSRVLTIHCPTNANWRFRVLYQEQERGPKGMLLRAVEEVSNAFSTSKSTGYSGPLYMAQTAESAN